MIQLFGTHFNSLPYNRSNEFFRPLGSCRRVEILVFPVRLGFWPQNGGHFFYSNPAPISDVLRVLCLQAVISSELNAETLFTSRRRTSFETGKRDERNFLLLFESSPPPRATSRKILRVYTIDFVPPFRIEVGTYESKNISDFRIACEFWKTCPHPLPCVFSKAMNTLSPRLFGTNKNYELYFKLSSPTRGGVAWKGGSGAFTFLRLT